MHHAIARRTRRCSRGSAARIPWNRLTHGLPLFFAGGHGPVIFTGGTVSHTTGKRGLQLLVFSHYWVVFAFRTVDGLLLPVRLYFGALKRMHVFQGTKCCKSSLWAVRSFTCAVKPPPSTRSCIRWKSCAATCNTEPFKTCEHDISSGM